MPAGDHDAAGCSHGQRVPWNEHPLCELPIAGDSSTVPRCMRPSSPFPYLLAFGMAACGGSQPQGALGYGESARREYERAMQAFEDHDCLTAQPLFENIRREYPYSRYAALAELRRADCELEQAHYTEAIRAYRSFMRQRPTHPDVDDASFAIAKAYFRQIPNEFFLSPPPEERDQASARSALRAVRQFLREFPDSEHVEEARQIERQVLALLARHELFVAAYYLQRDRPEATLTRLRTLLDEFEGSGVEPEAMILLGRTHLRMGEVGEARRVFGELIDRFPDSGYATQARNYLRAIDGDRRAPTAGTGERLPSRDRPAAPSDADDGGRADGSFRVARGSERFARREQDWDEQGREERRGVHVDREREAGGDLGREEEDESNADRIEESSDRARRSLR